MHHLQDLRSAAPQDCPQPIQPYELRKELVPGLCPCIGLPKCGQPVGLILHWDLPHPLIHHIDQPAQLSEGQLQPCGGGSNISATTAFPDTVV